jgi:hypothetical protein
MDGNLSATCIELIRAKMGLSTGSYAIALVEELDEDWLPRPAFAPRPRQQQGTQVLQQKELEAVL